MFWRKGDKGEFVPFTSSGNRRGGGDNYFRKSKKPGTQGKDLPLNESINRPEENQPLKTRALY